jgi:CheY-like chemotaxis protein
MSEESGVPVIAVVDDDESVRQSLAGFFESVGYEVALFSSAEEFAGSGCRRDDLPCLILDVCLPGMSGFELYSQLTLSRRERRWRRRRVGDAVAPARRRQGVQEVFANEAADEARGAGETQPAGERNRSGFWHSTGPG